MTISGQLSSQPVATVLEDLARPETAIAGGAAAAICAAFAASLATLVARASRPEWQDAGGAIAQAQALRARLTELASTDAQAYARARRLLLRTGNDRSRHGAAIAPDGALTAGPDHQDELSDALAAAARAPVELAEAAAEVAALCAWAAAAGNPDARADAVAGALLARAAAQTGAHLVEINLATRDDDADLARARAAARAAAEACAPFEVA